MDLSLEPQLLEKYGSPSQQARVLTENWAETNLYCPNCLEPHVAREAPGTKVIDFHCPNVNCMQTYQLKGKKHPFTTLVTDAAYDPMILSIKSGAVPNLVLLHYDRPRLRVVNVDVVPRFFLSSSCIIPRKPLSAHARRANWVGCSISLEMLPPDARIPIVHDETVEEPKTVQAKYRRFVSLLGMSWKERGWTADVLRCLRDIGKRSFSLKEVYEFEDELRRLHPSNRFVRPKIRQQLQILRDHGIIRFDYPGHYELL